MSRRIVGSTALALAIGILIGWSLPHSEPTPRTPAETPEGCVWVIRTDPEMAPIASHSGSNSTGWKDQQYTFTFRDREDAWKAYLAVKTAVNAEYRRVLDRE